MTQLTVELPDDIFEQIRQAAEQSDRSIDELLVEALTASVPSGSVPVQQLRSDLAQMAFMNDAALWQAARAAMTADQRERMEALNLKQQREGLTESEMKEAEALHRLYEDTLLVRAQAAVLLKRRRYDVSDPAQFAPLA